MEEIERKSLKILASSTRRKQGETELTRRLEAAAESGDMADYDRAKDTFDALPIEQRRTIGAGAIQQAETVREKRKAVRAESPAVEPDAAGLEWVLGRIPGNPETKTPKEPPRFRPDRQKEPTGRAKLDGEGKDWDWRSIPDDPALGRGKKKPMDPFEELRQQLLGPQSGQTWKRRP